MGGGAAGERRQHGEDQQRQRERAEAIAAALWSLGASVDDLRSAGPPLGASVANPNPRQ